MKTKVSLILTLCTGFIFVYAQNNTSIDDLCSSSKKYKIELNSSSKFVVISPKDFKSEGDPYYTHKTDLNNDGKDDLIINLKDCYDPTHCKFGVFIQCEDGNYVSAYKPEYWLPSFRISKNTEGWKEIILFERDEAAFNEGRKDKIITPKDTLEFQNTIYKVRHKSL